MFGRNRYGATRYGSTGITTAILYAIVEMLSSAVVSSNEKLVASGIAAISNVFG